MDDNMIWCTLIAAVAYSIKDMIPSHYEMFHRARAKDVADVMDEVNHLDKLFSEHNLRICGLEERVEILIKRVDAINDAVDDNEQTMLGMGKKLEDLQSDVAGHLTRIDDLEARHD